MSATDSRLPQARLLTEVQLATSNLTTDFGSDMLLSHVLFLSVVFSRSDFSGKFGDRWMLGRELFRFLTINVCLLQPTSTQMLEASFHIARQQSLSAATVLCGDLLLPAVRPAEGLRWAVLP